VRYLLGATCLMNSDLQALAEAVAQWIEKRAALVTNMSVSPMMALSGVRSSWLTLETNCDLCSLASVLAPQQ
jgi:hypothetical protein